MEEELKKIIRAEIAAVTHTNDDEILNAAEAANYLRVQRSTIYDLKARGKLPFHQVGYKIVFFKSELKDWVKTGKAAD